VPDPSTYRPAPGSVPVEPGVYRFSDSAGRVLYVGKAKSLRSRLNSYFQDLSALHPRTLAMVTSASKVEWTVVRNEVEALQLEYSWIKEFDPRFNVRYRDDKSYPYLAVTLDEEFPRAMVMRGAKKRGVRYFGPYAHAWAIRETLDQLLRVFQVRSCSAGVFRRSAQVGRPCLLGYIGKCSAPCVGRVSAEEHRLIVDDLVAFLDGQTAKYIRRLEREMRAAAAVTDYERAARLRDDITALQRAMEQNAVVLGDTTDADVVALAEDPLEVAVHIFYVRGGRVRGERGWVADKADDAPTGALVERFLIQLYGEHGNGGIPREILVPALPDDQDEALALSELLARLRGGPVEIRIPRRGDKRALLETGARNAGQALALHKTRRASDLTTRSRALEEIQLALGLDEAPLRIEAYDVSNLQGTDAVASMIVFEDGLPRKSEYRRFAIRGLKTGHGPDDVAAIREVLSRRFRRLTEERPAEVSQPLDPETGRPRKFAYTPGLVVVGLAKRLEEVVVDKSPDPVIMPRASEGLYLLQRVRDEAHRFAITYHRQRRSRSMVDSLLDGVPGLGPSRRKALLARFGSLRRLRAATATEIAQVPGIGLRTAEAVVAAVAQTTGSNRPAAPVNMTTGEILEPDGAAPN
jgi:excinuclease ABC subunit C